jgi:hypothetical protein
MSDATQRNKEPDQVPPLSDERIAEIAFRHANGWSLCDTQMLAKDIADAIRQALKEAGHD